MGGVGSGWLGPGTCTGGGGSGRAGEEVSEGCPSSRARGMRDCVRADSQVQRATGPCDRTCVSVE